METAAEHGIDLVVNLTPGVSEPIVRAYPAVAVRNMEGDRSPHWMCPSNPDVRNYFYGRALDILAHQRSVREIELDVVSIDFYDPQVVPEWVTPELSPLKELAAGSCFCDHCQKKATEAGLDIPRVIAQIKDVGRQANDLSYENFKGVADAYRGVFDIVRLILRHAELVRWLDFRGTLVDDFVRGIRGAIQRTGRDVLVTSDFCSPSFSWKLGQIYANQPSVTDAIKLMLYHRRIGSFEVKPLRNISRAIPLAKESEILDQYYRLKGFSGPGTFEEFAARGIDVENVYYEVKKAKRETNREYPIIAGLVGDPPATAKDVREAVEAAFRGGADGYMLHQWYHGTPKENVEAFGEKLKELGVIR